jgi:hypothetical protein
MLACLGIMKAVELALEKGYLRLITGRRNVKARSIHRRRVRSRPPYTPAAGETRPAFRKRGIIFYCARFSRIGLRPL